MLTLLATLVGFGLFALALALGVLLGGRALRGSCGGGGCPCGDACAGACPRRRARPAEENP